MIILIIIILFIGSFICLISVGRDFRKELNHLETLDRELQTSSEPNIFFQSVSSLISKDSLVFERFHIVFRLCSKNIRPSLYEISELTIPKKKTDRKNRFANLVISVLLIIGLGGTFWAFRDILTNSELNQVISSDGVIDGIKYQESINKIYGGFQHAFWASLLGIFGTVILVFVKFLYVNPIQEEFFSRLDFITQMELIPLLAKPKQSAAILLAAAVKLDAVVADIQSISHNLHGSTTQANNMGSAFTQFASIFKDAIQILQETTSDKSPLVKTMGKLFEEVKNSEHRFKKLIDEVKTQNTLLADTQNTFTKLHTLLGADFKNTISQIQGLISSVGNIEMMVQQLPKTSYSKEFDDVQKVLDKIKSDVHQLPKNSYSKEFDEIHSLLKGLDKIETAVQQLSKNSYSKEFTEIQRLLKGLETAVQQLPKNSYSKEFTEIQRLLKGLDKIETAVQQLPYSKEFAEIQRILKGLDNLDKIETAVQQLPKISYSEEFAEIQRILKGLDNLDKIEIAVQQLPKNSYSKELAEIQGNLKQLHNFDEIMELSAQLNQLIGTIREIHNALKSFEEQESVDDSKRRPFNLPFFGNKK